MQSSTAKMAPLGLSQLLLMWEHEAEALGRRREGEGGLHELRWPRGHGLGALHRRHLPLGHRRVVFRHDVREPAGGAVLAEPPCVVHARLPRGHLGVAQREAPAVRAARRGPAVVLVRVRRVTAIAPHLERPEDRRRGRGGELGARPGDDRVEEVVWAEGEADHFLVAVVVDEEHAHDLGGVLGVERVHPLKHGLGDLPCVHGAARAGTVCPGGEASRVENGGTVEGEVKRYG
jgi:hypothetical protein